MASPSHATDLAAYCAIAVEIESERETGRIRVKRAVPGRTIRQVVNPDGVRNQIERAILQSSSWTLYESVTFDETRITSVDRQHILFCASIACRTASRSTSSIARACHSSALARLGRGLPPPRSPMPSPMRQDNVCAICL